MNIFDKLKNRFFGFKISFGGPKKEPLRKRLKFWTSKIKDKSEDKAMKKMLLAVGLLSVVSSTGCVAMMKSTVRAELTALAVHAETNRSCEELYKGIYKFIDEKLK